MKYKNKVHVKNVGKHSNIVFRAVVLQDIEHFRKSAYQVVKNSPLALHLKSGSSFSRSFCAASMQRLLPEVIKSA